MCVVVGDRAETRKAEFDEGCEPFARERITERIEIRDDIVEIGDDEMGQEPSVVQRGPPADELPLVGLLPETSDQRAQQQYLHGAHSRMRGHLERAEFEEAEPAGRRVRRIELVDGELGAVRVAGQVREQMAQQPVD